MIDGTERDAPLSDAGNVADIFVTELAVVERLDGNHRLIFACRQRGPDGQPERLVVGRVIMSEETLAATVNTLSGHWRAAGLRRR